MSGPSFTSGPWSLRHSSASVDDNVSYGVGVTIINTWVGFGTDKLVVAYAVDYANTIETPRLDANARLIAAAPDLYEALELARKSLRFAAPGQNRALAKIEAALAKARGEQ